jgi:predicted aspartyl protease
MSKIYKALYAVEPQIVTVEEEQHIPILRDVVGLMNVEVTISDSSHNFIFDTGAGMSVVTRSFAENNNFKIYDVDIDVKAATGNVIKSSMAVIDSFQFGEIKIYNAVFLVMNDELMQFPQINYYPLGIIGFPIIEDFKEITITKTDTLIVPQSPQMSDLNNMRLNSLVPHVNLFNGKDTLEYAFDTGAKSSHLTNSYLKLYEDELMIDAEIDTITTVSAGGSKIETALVNNTISLFIGKEKAVLSNIDIHNSHNHTFEDVYGNLGQDLIRQFDRMTLNFESMYLKFE